MATVNLKDDKGRLYGYVDTETGEKWMGVKDQYGVIISFQNLKTGDIRLRTIPKGGRVKRFPPKKDK